MSITSVVNDLVTSVSVINALKPLPPTISGYSVAGKDDLALDPAGGQTVQINGTGFLPGATITFDGSAVAVVTYVNPNQLTFTSPAKTAGTYTIYAVNPDGGTAIYVPGIIYSTLPTWTTAAGSLGSYYETTSISNTVVAAGDAPVTYSLYSGSLPTGSTLSANGVITGTAPVDSSSTTYSFTIQASDAQLQDSTRSFSLTINVDAVTWVSPANATTYTSAVDSAISTVTLNATDAAGYSVSYSANALPTGLSLTGANITGTPTVIADSSTLLTATAATTNRTAVRTINWSITVANDPYFEYNTLLIPGASTTFVDDASTNNFAVSINGDTKPNNFNPYTPGYYSNYFDGNGDFLTVPNNAALAFGSGDFCLEFWIYTTAFGSTDSRPLGNNNTWAANAWSLHSDHGTANEKYTFWVNNYNSGVPMFTSTSSVVLNIWTHVAITRSGTSWRMFVNGVQEGSTVTSSAALDGGSSDDIYIGGSGAGNEYVTGYMSNVRAVKGAAVYTSNFTPSTTPLTAIANTSLLTCQSNRFIDNSTNNFTITVFGNTTVNSFDPFTPNSSYSTYGSGYFDGTGDYLTLPSASQATLTANSNFTFESYVYLTGYSGTYNGIWGGNSGDIVLAYSSTNSWGLYPALAGSPPFMYSGMNVLNGMFNRWAHVALTRNGNSWNLWVDGVSVATATQTSTSIPNTTKSIGSEGAGANTMMGYISDARYTSSAVYTTTFTPPSAPLTAIANTQLLTLQNNQSVNNSVFLDNSTNNSFITRAGNATQGTFSPYGANWSNYFTNNILSCGNASLIAGTNTFTIEFWVYLNSINSGGGNNQTFIDTRSSNGVDSTAWLVGVINSTNLKWFTGTSDTNLGGTLPYRQWVHVAYTRNASNVITAYINGVATGTTTIDSRNLTNTNFWIGGNVSNTYPLDGYFSNVRWVVGTVVYTGNFTPSTTPLTAISNTKLLTCQSNRFIDNSGNNISISLTGSPTIQRFSPFSPSAEYSTSTIGGSAYFDGTTSNIITTNTVTTLGTQDFCLEAWVYCFSTTSYACIIGNDAAGPSQGCFIEMGTTRGIWLGGPEVSLGSARYNQWFHVVFCRVSGTYAGFLNGTRQATGAFSFNLSIAMKIGINNYVVGSSSGFGTTGYISDGRVTVGSSPYSPSSTTITVPTAPLTAVQNTVFLSNMTSAGVYDAAMMTTMETVADAKLSTAVSKFGGSSMSFDGSGDYLSTYDPSYSLSVGSGDFTFECWLYVNSLPGTVTAVYHLKNDAALATTVFVLEITPTGAISISTGLAIIANGTSGKITTGSWIHFAFVRTSGVFKTFFNGTQDISTSNTTTYNGTYLQIGAFRYTAYDFSLNGYIDDLRVTKGYARYTSNFTAPTTAFPIY